MTRGMRVGGGSNASRGRRIVGLRTFQRFSSCWASPLVLAAAVAPRDAVAFSLPACATAAPAPGTTGAGFANSPGFAPALGARNALPDDGAKAPPALSPPACASISLVRRVR